jgi:hypothetical protein
MSWWDFLTLLFGPSRRRHNISPPKDFSRLRRAWRRMRAMG